MLYKTPIRRFRRETLYGSDRWLGRIFQMWHVKIKSPIKGMFICQCLKCGEYEEKEIYNLANKKRTHRCKNCDNLAMIGKKFGAWKVIKQAPRDKREMAYTCKCDCGNTRNVRKSALLGNESLQCIKCQGKQKRLPLDHLDFLGKRLNKIVFLEMVMHKERLVVKCLCDCGKIIFIHPTFLRKIQGNGCLKCSNNGRKK